VRARALHPDVIAVTSALLQVNCVIVRGPGGPGEPAPPAEAGALNVVEVAPGQPGAEAFVIDSPVLPEELELLPSVLDQAGFPAPSGLIATHADWDHVMGPLAFPEVPLGVAESSARRLGSEPGAAQRELRAFDEELYLERPRPLQLGALQALPVPGRCEIGTAELELHPTGGHTPDGMAIVVPWAGVLIAGDYLSPVEIPMLNEGGGTSEYLETLERLRPLVAAARHVVPGHGPPIEGAQAAAILDEDAGYLRALAERGAEAELPEGRRSPEMRRIHARNAARAAETR
jgi:glyoxylase-like metal-dependent hydrolase (beta-lactamase superfamily II)